MPRGVVPEGLMKVAQYEVLGWRSKKTTRPGWDDRRLLTLVKPHTRGPGAKTLRSSLPGRTSLCALFPSTSYWATFIESLRDDSSRHISLPLMLARMRGRGTDRFRLVAGRCCHKRVWIARYCSVRTPVASAACGRVRQVLSQRFSHNSETRSVTGQSLLPVSSESRFRFSFFILDAVTRQTSDRGRPLERFC